MKINLSAILWVAIMLVPAGGFAGQARAESIQARHYLESIGNDTEDILWCLHQTRYYRLIYKTKSELDITHMDATFGSTLWENEVYQEDLKIMARRENNTIVIRGSRGGKAIEKKITIDENPWYQALSWSLRRFVLSEEETIQFWVLRPGTLKAYKLVARKKKKGELMQVNGGQESATRIELRPAGMLAPFWKSSYWFRSSDGFFLRFKGASGPPGTPDIIVEYRGPAQPCDITRYP